MTEISEQRELSLVGKVELRIALVETDSKLESTLNTYLPPLLVWEHSRWPYSRQSCTHFQTAQIGL